MLYVYFVKKNNDVEGKNATKKVSSVTFKILHQFLAIVFIININRHTIYNSHSYFLQEFYHIIQRAPLTSYFPWPK